MKILIIHNNYNHIGGPESYMYSIQDTLKMNGHDCEIFTFKDNNNVNQKFNNLLPTLIFESNNWNKNYKQLNLINIVRILINSFFNVSVYKSLNNVVKIYKPDVIYLLQFHMKLSTSVIDAAKKNKIPIVCRISDYNRICSKNILYRDNQICLKCINNDFNMLRYNCNENIFYTILDYLVRKFNEKRKIFNYIHSYIAPTKFTKTIFELDKKFKNKFTVIATPFKNISSLNFKNEKQKNVTFIYFGRISYDKGVDLIIKGFNAIKSDRNINLKLIGETDKYIENLNFDNENIIISKKIDKNELMEQVILSKFSIFYSRWYDNLPNSLIESCSLGVPVIIPNFGSFRDLIESGMPCLSFDPQTENDFEITLLKASNLTHFEYSNLSTASKNWISINLNANNHYNSLLNVFNNAINS